MSTNGEKQPMKRLGKICQRQTFNHANSCGQNICLCDVYAVVSWQLTSTLHNHVVPLFTVTPRRLRPHPQNGPMRILTSGPLKANCPSFQPTDTAPNKAPKTTAGTDLIRENHPTYHPNLTDSQRNKWYTLKADCRISEERTVTFLTFNRTQNWPEC